MVGLLFGSLIAGEALLGVLTFRAKQKTEKSLKWLRDSYGVVEQLDAVSLKYKELWPVNISELNGVGFMDTAKIDSARKELGTGMGILKTLIGDNPVQQEQVGLLEDLLEEQFSFLDSLRNHAQSSALFSFSVSYGTLDYNSEIGKIIAHMKLEERRWMGIREVENRKDSAAFTHVFYLLLAGMCCVVIITFLAIKLAFDRGVGLQLKMKRIGELHEKFFNESPVGMIIIRKRDGVVIDGNKAYCELVNGNAEDTINKPPAILEESPGMERYSSLLSSESIVEKMVGIELQLQPNSNSALFTFASIQSLCVKEEPCLLLAFQDMSLYKKAEQDIRRSLMNEIGLNKMKIDFVTQTSHEFRTPLSTMLSSAFLIESCLSLEKQEIIIKHLNRIRSAVNTMTFLVEEFLSLSRIEKEQIVAEPEEVLIKDYIENHLKTLEPSLKQGQQTFYNHEGDTIVYTDPVLMSKIIDILISNSVKFSTENSEIHISTKVSKGFSIKVIDFGLGIPREDLCRVFERFFRASNAGNIQGIGLGLHILKHYVEMLRGKVAIKSIPNNGTEVSIYFKGTKYR